MRKFVALKVALFVLFAVVMAGCSSGTPTPPVNTLVKLDKLVAISMTQDQVNALMTPTLKSTSVLYQADVIQQAANGNWAVSAKQGGYAAGEQGAYQALFFTPTRAGDEYYAVFFKGNIVMAKAWFSPQNAVVIEALLKGETVVK
jgi:hypothetical protein